MLTTLFAAIQHHFTQTKIPIKRYIHSNSQISVLAKLKTAKNEQSTTEIIVLAPTGVQDISCVHCLRGALRSEKKDTPEGNT
jgi:hypothetical protein